MWAARVVTSSCLVSGSPVTLCAASSLRHQTIHAASTSAHTKASTAHEPKNAVSQKSPRLRIKTAKFQGAKRYDQRRTLESHKGKDKATGYTISDGQNSKSAAREPLSAGLKPYKSNHRSKRKHSKPPIARSSRPGKTESRPIAREKAAKEEKAAEEQRAAEWEALASVQDRLRSYFSRPKTNAGEPSSSAKAATGITNDNHQHAGVEEKGTEHESSSQGLVDQVDAGAEADTPPPSSYSRPTLAELQSAEMDQFVGLYQSPTAWNPDKDYALMPEGPERESLLRASLAQGRQQYIVVVLDGDNLFFDPRHLNQGYEGGKFVYQEIRQRIAKKHQLIPERLDLRIRYFCALNPLSSVLHRERLVTKMLFFDFLQGLTDSNLHNYIVNVGRGDQAADLRVKAALADALHDERCFRAYLGGLDDFGYMEDLYAIQEMGLLETKVHLIQVPGYAVETRTYRRYAHRAIDLDYLFKNKQQAVAMMKTYVSARTNPIEASPIHLWAPRV